MYVKLRWTARGRRVCSRWKHALLVLIHPLSSFKVVQQTPCSCLTILSLFRTPSFQHVRVMREAKDALLFCFHTFVYIDTELPPTRTPVTSSVPIVEPEYTKSPYPAIHSMPMSSLLYGVWELGRTHAWLLFLTLFYCADLRIQSEGLGSKSLGLYQQGDAASFPPDHLT